MSRSDALSLASVLHGAGFNLLVYDLRGNGASPRGASSLGLCETDDMLAVLRFMKSRSDINRARLGIWGVDESARAALAVAASHPEVRAIAADAPYESVSTS